MRPFKVIVCWVLIRSEAQMITSAQKFAGGTRVESVGAPYDNGVPRHGLQGSFYEWDHHLAVWSIFMAQQQPDISVSTDGLASCAHAKLFTVHFQLFMHLIFSPALLQRLSLSRVQYSRR